MDAVSKARVAVLHAQGNCPACGALISVHGMSAIHHSALFRCGAIIDVQDGLPLSVLKACPNPSNVAVAQLNRQAVALAKDVA